MKTRTQNSKPRTQNSECSRYDPRSTIHDPRSFTLIEMLAVVGIIAILCGILYPALRTIRDGPKKAQCRADIRKLELAIQSYYNEYGKWPPTPANASEFYGMMNGNRKPYDGTAGAAYCTNNNPRGIRFLELDKKQVSSINEFLDPWGTRYWICLDNGGPGFGDDGTTILNNWGDFTNWNGPVAATNANDGIIRYRNAESYTLKKTIGIYSWGPNKAENDAAGPEYDDISNWY